MLIRRYLVSNAHLPAVLSRIVSGAPPEKFTVEHLKSLGFSGSNERAIPSLLKELGFLTDSGAPTHRYHAYRDPSKSRIVLGETLLEKYSDLFQINEKLSTSDRIAIEGKFRASTGMDDLAAQRATATFLALLKLSDVSNAQDPVRQINSEIKLPDLTNEPENNQLQKSQMPSLRYNIEVHLPATQEVGVYHAIFKALKEHFS